MRQNLAREAGRLRRLVLAVLCALGAAGAPAVLDAAETRYQIHLLTGTLTPPAGVAPADLDRLHARAAAVAGQGQTTVHVLVQLREIPTPAQTKALSGTGLDLGPYATGNAWIAAVPVDRLADVARLRQVRWLAPWDASLKLHPRLRERRIGSWARDPEHPGWVMTFMQLHHDVALERGSEIAQRAGGVALDPVEGLHGMTVWVPDARIGELAAAEEVLWVEEGPMPLSPNNDGIRSQMKVGALQAAPYSLNGLGIRLFVFDGGTAQTDHATFGGIFGSTRATAIDAAPMTDHATHVAGTAAGNGSGSDNGRGRGMAPWAYVYSAAYEQILGQMAFWDNAGDLETDYALAANTYNVDLATNSIGSNNAFYYGYCEREGDYGETARSIDAIVRGDNPAIDRPLLVTWSNGNERTGGCGGGFATMAPPACAKNPIHVGATNSDGSSMTVFSSWGPCDDGRLKPTLVAPGCETGLVTGENAIYSSLPWDDYGATIDSEPICGTSMATPAVAGTLALFIQDWRAQGHGGPAERPLPALVKAMLIHTAKDLGPSGPDYMNGYGAVDAKALIDLLRADNGTLGDGSGRQWGTDALAQGTVKTYSINVTAGTSDLKATLAWDDPAAAAFAANSLVNNLTLDLVAPDGTVHKAWALSAGSPGAPATKTGNAVDNQEQVLVASPATGTWTVRVTGTAVPVGPQAYGLAYSTGGVNGTCATRTWDFEAGAPGAVVTGIIENAPPGSGVGAKSLRLQRLDSFSVDVTIPSSAARAELSYAWLMQTAQTGNQDLLWVSIVDPRTWDTLAVVDLRSDGWPKNQWMTEPGIDLMPWAGKTIRIYFEATEPDVAWIMTDHFLDNVKVTTCLPLIFLSPTENGVAIGSQDGAVIESSQFSSVGGTVVNPLGSGTIQVGDTSNNAQSKGFLSFDTSAIPDNATILRARLLLRRSSVSGTNPFLTHGTILADIQTGGFGGSTTLAASDFQAGQTAQMVAALSPALNNGDLSESYLSSDGLAAISKTGTTQLRLFFQKPDNNDLSTDLVHFDTGDAATSSFRPQLYVTYFVP